MEEEKTENLQVRGFPKTLWAEFKKDVLERTGKTHGVLGPELAELVKQHLYGGGGTFPRRGVSDAQKRTPGTGEEKINPDNIVYGKQKVDPINAREHRMGEIGKILFGNQASAVVQGKENFIITVKGLEKLVISQKVSTDRVIKDYIHSLEVRGWIEKISGKRYTILPATICEDLHLEYPEGYIEKVVQRRKEEEQKA